MDLCRFPHIPEAGPSVQELLRSSYGDPSLGRALVRHLHRSPSSRKPEKGHETGAPETVNQTVSPPQSIAPQRQTFTCRINKPTARQNS